MHPKERTVDSDLPREIRGARSKPHFWIVGAPPTFVAESYLFPVGRAVCLEPRADVNEVNNIVDQIRLIGKRSLNCFYGGLEPCRECIQETERGGRPETGL